MTYNYKGGALKLDAELFLVLLSCSCTLVGAAWMLTDFVLFHVFWMNIPQLQVGCVCFTTNRVGINFSLTVCCVYCRLVPAWECCYTCIGIVIIIIIRHLHCSQVLVQDASLQTSLDVVKGCLFFYLPSHRQQSCMENIHYIQNFILMDLSFFFFVTKFSFSSNGSCENCLGVCSGYTGLQGCVLLQCCRPF